MKSIITLVLVLVSMTALAQTDTIWPGDANYDGYCNHEDVLIIGMKFGVTGPQRDSSERHILWLPLASHTWQDTLVNSVTTNHADCNGDGIINDHDLLAIELNFGEQHDTTLAAVNGFSAISATNQDPHLSFNLGQLDSVFVSDTVIVEVLLGTQGVPAVLTGLAFSMGFTSSLVDTMFVRFDSSMLHPGTARVDFSRTEFVAGQAYVTSILANQTAVQVAGNVATLIIVMEGNIAGKTDVLQDTLVLCPDRIIAVNQFGSVVPIFGECDSVIVYDADSRVKPAPPATDILIRPNPSNGNFIISSNQNPMKDIIITNALGQVVLHEAFEGGREEIIFNLPLPSGLYIASVRTRLDSITQKIQIIR